MSRFSGGWIKIHRDLMQKDIAQHGTLLALWVYLLAIANYKPSQILWNGQQKILERGQLLFKIREISDKWECSPTTIWKWLHYLSNTGRIVVEARTRGTIVTICNYDQYQSNEDTERTPNEHQVNTARTPSEHGVDYSKESKKERTEERKKTNVGIRADYPQDFDAVWIKYGKRGDKKAAFEEWKKLNLTEIELAMLNRSIDHYVKNNELKFRKHLCRFLKTDWREMEPALEPGNENKSLKWDGIFGSPTGGERDAANG